MLVKFVRFFAARTKLTAMLWALTVTFGLLCYTTLMPREGFPSVQIPIAVMSGTYFVDDAATVDQDIAIPLVEELSGQPGIESVSTTARDSTFTVVVSLEQDLTPDDGVEILTGAVAAADLPESANYQIRKVDGARFFNEFDSLVAIYGPANTSAADLEAAARSLIPVFEDVPEVAEAKVVEVIRRGVNPTTGDEIEEQSGYTQITVDEGGGPELRPAVSLGLVGSQDADALSLRDATDALLDSSELQEGLPADYGVTVAADFATSIRQQIGSLQSNVLTGLIAVALIALLLISWRASIIAAVFIATVLATTMGVLYLVGISLNTISLFGVILALGLFVDDAIVITEAIEAFRTEASKPLDIIGRAIKRVGSASISGTLTTLLVFAPMLAISGILGQFISILPISVMIALSVSLILSLVFIPLAAKLLILSRPASAGLLAPVEARLANAMAATSMQTGRRGAVNALVGIGLSVAMTGIGLFVFLPRVEFNIFPPQKDSIEIEATYSFPPGTEIIDAEIQTGELNQQVVGLLGDDLEQVFTYLGSAGSSTTRFTLSPIGDRATAPSLIEDVLKPFGEQQSRADVIFSEISAGPPVSQFPFQAQLYGEDPDTLDEVAAEIASTLDGATITRPNGTSFTVLETEVGLGDVVAREDGLRYVEVRARFDADDVSAITAVTQSWLEERFDAQRLEDAGLAGDSLSFDFGLESDNQESFASMPRAFGFALLAMLVLLMIQFRSTIQWLLVFLAIPFSFFGVFGGLLITDNSLSFFVMLGLLGLIGIAVNNTILLVDFANQERSEGAGRRQAISTAIRRRFRPLVATSLTTVAGLLPLALSDPFWEALGYTIIFGLLSSTFLVVVSFPFYYLGIEWLRDRVNTPWRHKRPSVDGDDGLTAKLGDEPGEGELITAGAKA